jgi:hypothetical protein
MLWAPGLDDDLGMSQAREPVLVETLVAESPVERLDVRILVGLPRLNEAQRHATVLRLGQHGASAELLSIIRTQDPRQTAFSGESVKRGSPATRPTLGWGQSRRLRWWHRRPR